MYKRNSWNVNAEARATNPNTEADWLHYFKTSEMFQVSVAVLNPRPFGPHYLYSSCNIIRTKNSMHIGLVRFVASLRHLRQLQSFSRETLLQNTVWETWVSVIWQC